MLTMVVPSFFALDEEDWSWDDQHWWEEDPWAAHTGWWDDESEWFEETGPEADDKKEEAPRESEAMVQQTWSQAHRSTQLARKDRGFGKVGSKGSEGCHICGHPSHYARDLIEMVQKVRARSTTWAIRRMTMPSPLSRARGRTGTRAMART